MGYTKTHSERTEYTIPQRIDGTIGYLGVVDDHILYTDIDTGTQQVSIRKEFLDDLITVLSIIRSGQLARQRDSTAEEG